MNKRLYALLLALCIALGCLAGCSSNPAQEESVPVNEAPAAATDAASAEGESIDYAGTVKLDMNSSTLKQEVTVKSFIDGDTTHFYVPESVAQNGVLKARYLAVNTPESTGKIEEWGKKASNFTREKLESAESIIIESDNGTWNLDSTGGRHLVWVWYKPAGSDTYRNLNIELLQNGLSVASGSADNQYGEICVAAITQAKAQELHVHSKKDDPDFYYGDAVPVTLKELRTNTEMYSGIKVTFEGVVCRESSQTVYVEEYDPETDMYYGMTVYYAYNLTGAGLGVLKTGNRVKIVGSLQYYETGGTWQVSDIHYADMRPNDPNNIQLISQGHTPANRPITGSQLNGETVTVEVWAGQDSEISTIQTFDYAQLALSTSVSMENLYVTDVYTTSNEDSANKGAMTLTCQTSDGQYVSVRTVVLRDAEGNLITADAYRGKTINITGIVDFFSGAYQIKVFTPDDITVVG